MADLSRDQAEVVIDMFDERIRNSKCPQDPVYLRSRAWTIAAAAQKIGADAFYLAQQLNVKLKLEGAGQIFLDTVPGFQGVDSIYKNDFVLGEYLSLLVLEDARNVARASSDINRVHATLVDLDAAFGIFQVFWPRDRMGFPRTLAELIDTFNGVLQSKGFGILNHEGYKPQSKKPTERSDEEFSKIPNVLVNLRAVKLFEVFAVIKKIANEKVKRVSIRSLLKPRWANPIERQTKALTIGDLIEVGVCKLLGVEGFGDVGVRELYRGIRKVMTEANLPSDFNELIDYFATRAERSELARREAQRDRYRHSEY